MLLDHSKSATTIQDEKVLKLESKVLMSPVVINREQGWVLKNNSKPRKITLAVKNNGKIPLPASLSLG